MTTESKVIRNFYRDSVSLMQLSSRLAKLPGIIQASAIMASEANLALLREATLLAGASDAGPNDLLIALEGKNDEALTAAMMEADAALSDKPKAGGGGPRKQEPLRSIESLVPLLLLLLFVCFALAAFLVRMITGSLQRLSRAADEIGANPDRAPLAESGPSEVRRVIAAFNRMQQRVREYLIERGRLLSAISHDLKTPITRLRLRAEMLKDDEIRGKMLRDLDEMQTMVGATLNFFGSVGKETQRQPVDVAALIESVCEDRRESGQALSVRGAPLSPYRADPQALRRCLENLIENAVRYGSCADIDIDDSPQRLRIAIRDRGPGIPEGELEKVFEPFYRLEASRNMASGGTGLGLSIARNIARWHGGEVRLANAAPGLVAELALPR